MPVRPALAIGAGSFVVVLASTQAVAHTAAVPTPETIWRSWNSDPWLVTVILITCLAYYRGAGQFRAAAGRQKRAPALCYWSAMILLMIALLSPLAPLGTALGSAHMLQHTILFFAAPLLILSYPVATFLWSLPRAWRVQLNRRTQRSLVASGWRIVSSPTVAWTFHAAILWAWHGPPLYQAAMDVKWLHDLMHFSFLFSGLLLWWAIFQKLSTGLLLLFTTMLHGGLLAALMTFSGQVWYPYYTETTAAWGLTPLEDQQLAGMVMWVLGGLGYLLAGLGMLGLWLQRLEAQAGPVSLKALPARSYNSDS